MTGEIAFNLMKGRQLQLCECSWPQWFVLLCWLIIEKHIKSTFANSEDPDEMQHDAAFHQGLHCL